jgi:positive regulator of sigma E activity
LSDEEKNEEDRKEALWGQLFKGLGIGLEVLIFAFVGYFVAQWLGYNEIWGMFAGALFGTFLMWFQLFRFVKKISKESEGEK